MRDNLIAIVVALVITALVACQAAAAIRGTPHPMLAVTKTCYVTGAHTPEAVFLEADWLELDT